MKYSLKRAKVVALTFGLLLTLGAVACGQGGTPTPTPGPTLPTSQELRQAGDDLFSALSTAVQAQDGAAFHELLVAPLRERCTVEQVQGALAGDVPFLDVDVTAVFLDLENPSRALVRVALQEGPEGFPFPFPMVREEGKWRLDLLALAGGLDTGEGCPFADDGEMGEEVVREEARPRALAPWEDFLGDTPSLEPPPGVSRLGGGSGRSIGEASASALLKTDMPLAALLEFYRQQVLEPGWEVQQEEVADDLAVLTWTFQVNDGFSWIGVLLIAPAGEDLRWVRLWMGGGGAPVKVADVPVR